MIAEHWEAAWPSRTRCGSLTALLALTALLLLTPAARAVDVPQSVLEAEQARIAAVAKAKKAAISVFSPGGGGGGSGVVVTPDGYALTNFHVVRPAGAYMQCSMPDGKLYDAVIVSIDPTGDVAMIKLLGRDDFPVATLADSDQVRVGDWCFAVGNPFLLATDFQPTVTYGIVSGVHRYQYPAGTLLEYADCIQTDASINPGNSGGPLFNADGDLIGINGRGSFEKRGRVNVGVGYAISINQIKHFMGYLRSGRIVDHATLGATVSSSDDGRVIVSNILESSDAFRRGLRYGDEIVAFGGRDITTTNGFKNVLGIFPRGWRVPLSFRREGKRYDVFVRLKGVHSPDELAEKLQPRRPQRPVQPKPKDGEGDDEKEAEKPDDNPEGDKPEGDKPRPQPRPQVRPGAPKKKAIPPAVKRMLKQRRGFANYYFNELNQQRVWDRFTEGGDYSDIGADWKLTGKMGGAEVAIEFTADRITGSFPVGPARVELGDDLSNQLGPDGSGGLLVTLHLWQRMLRIGPDRFGDVYYLGTMPLPGHDNKVDVLVGTFDVVECHYMFDVETGRLVAMELFTDPDNDPCELRILEEQDVDGRKAPKRIRVQHGDNNFGEIEWSKLEFGAADGEDA